MPSKSSEGDSPFHRESTTGDYYDHSRRRPSSKPSKPRTANSSWTGRFISCPALMRLWKPTVDPPSSTGSHLHPGIHTDWGRFVSLTRFSSRVKSSRLKARGSWAARTAHIDDFFFQVEWVTPKVSLREYANLTNQDLDDTSGASRSWYWFLLYLSFQNLNQLCPLSLHQLKSLHNGGSIKQTSLFYCYYFSFSCPILLNILPPLLFLASLAEIFLTFTGLFDICFPLLN